MVGHGKVTVKGEAEEEVAERREQDREVRGSVENERGGEVFKSALSRLTATLALTATLHTHPTHPNPHPPAAAPALHRPIPPPTHSKHRRLSASVCGAEEGALRVRG